VDQRAEHGPRVLLGYSMGARLALHVLLHRPEKWDAAILISPHPGLTSAEERRQRLAHDLSWHDRFLHAGDWPTVLAEWNAQPLLADGAPPAEMVSSHWQRDIALASDAWSLGHQEDLRPRFSSIPCPVLWLTGERDEKFTALAAAACPLLPRGEHRIIAGAGHRTHLDQPAAVAVAITRWCAGFSHRAG
jgi:2-succinyl-6-hydroxy-2,4-cyclohexadiene-1-carboxylate synthase